MLKITDTDTKHGIRIGNMDNAKYTENEVVLDTSNKGEFFFGCANYCGNGHMNMGGKIIVE